MEHINKEDLKLLDFILIKLSDIYPDGKPIAKLLHQYEKENNIKNRIESSKAKYIEELYKYKYFEQVGDSFQVKIYPETKGIIDNYGSLSKYINEINNAELNKINEDNDLKKLTKYNLELQNEILTLQRKHLNRYVLYSIISFIIGAILTNVKDILILWNTMNQE